MQQYRERERDGQTHTCIHTLAHAHGHTVTAYMYAAHIHKLNTPLIFGAKKSPLRVLYYHAYLLVLKELKLGL